MVLGCRVPPGSSTRLTGPHTCGSPRRPRGDSRGTRRGLGSGGLDVYPYCNPPRSGNKFCSPLFDRKRDTPTESRVPTPTESNLPPPPACLGLPVAESQRSPTELHAEKGPVGSGGVTVDPLRVGRGKTEGTCTLDRTVLSKVSSQQGPGDRAGTSETQTPCTVSAPDGPVGHPHRSYRTRPPEPLTRRGKCDMGDHPGDYPFTLEPS